ncbi:unnamed protein product [Lota lota]
MAGGASARFKLGDLVFAKMRGFPHWPARVIRTNDVSKKMIGVFFFGTHQIGLVVRDKVVPYVGNQAKYGNGVRIRGFTEGMWEIQNTPGVERDRTLTPEETRKEEEEEGGRKEEKEERQGTRGRRRGGRGGRGRSPAVKQESEPQEDRRRRRRRKRGAGVEEEDEEVKPPQRKRRRTRPEEKEEEEEKKEEEREEEEEEEEEEGRAEMQGMLGNVVEQQSVGESRGTLLDSTLHRIHGDLRIALKSDCPDVSRCVSALDQLSMLYVTSRHVQKHSELVSTLRKMRYYRACQAVMDKASMLYCRFKNSFLLGEGEEVLSQAYLHSLLQEKEREEEQRWRLEEERRKSGADGESRGEEEVQRTQAQGCKMSVGLPVRLSVSVQLSVCLSTCLSVSIPFCVSIYAVCICDTDTGALSSCVCVCVQVQLILPEPYGMYQP